MTRADLRDEVFERFVRDVDGLGLNLIPTFDRYAAAYPDLENDLADLATRIAMEIEMQQREAREWYATAKQRREYEPSGRAG